MVVSRVNDTPPIGPHYARPKPVEAHSKQAGDQSQARGPDVLRLAGGPGSAARPARAQSAAPSRAYLFVLILAIALVLGVVWWTGTSGLAGVGIGWITGLLVWAIRQDLARAVSDLFE